MSTSPRMRWPYPAEGVDPWYDAFQDMVRAQDATALALHDEKNIILTGGGDISWDAPTGVVSWTLPITLNSSQSGFIETVPAGSLYVPDDGQYGYVRFVPSPQDNVELVLRAADVLPASDVDRTFILFRRRQNKLYWRNGGVLSSGETAAIIDDGPGGGGGGGGAVNEVTATAPIVVTGTTSNPNIEFSGWPSDSTGVLTNDGSGNLTWEAAGGGSILGTLAHTQIAFGASDPNTIEGSHDFTWTDADKILYINGSIGVGLTDPNELLTLGGRLSLATVPIPDGVPSVEGDAGFGKLLAGTDGRPYWIDETGLVLNLTLDRFTDLGTTSTVTLDADPRKPVFNSVTLDGDTTFTTDNLGEGRSLSVRVVNSGVLRTLTFPAGWTWLGSGAPASLDAGKTGYLSLTAYGPADTDVIAAWSYEDMPSTLSGAGVANQIAFWTSSSNISGEDALWWNASSNRLGVGTSEPEDTVDIRGSLIIGYDMAEENGVSKVFAADHAVTNVPSAMWFALTDGATSGLKIINFRDGSFNSQRIELWTHHGGVTASARLSIDKDGAILAKNGANSTTAFQVQNAAGTAVLDVDTSNGRVGIGTSSPTVALSVVGDAEVREDTAGLTYFQVTNNSTNAAAIAGLYVGGNVDGSPRGPLQLEWLRNAPGSASYLGATGQIAAVRLEGATNVINFRGTATAPTVLWGVFDQEVASLTSTAWTFNSRGLSTFDFIVKGDTNPNLLFVDASANAVGVNTSSPFAGFLDVAAFFRARNVVNDVGAYQFNDSAGTVVMQVDTVNGRVGIRTTATPVAALDLASGQLAIPDGSAVAPSIAFRDDLDTGIYSSTNGTLNITSNGSETARFYTSSGSAILQMDTSILIGNINVADDTLQTAITMIAHSNQVVVDERNAGGQFLGVRSRGTAAAPTAVGADDGLASFNGMGLTSTPGEYRIGAHVSIHAEESFTTTALGSRIDFWTTPNGTDTSIERMRITNAGNVGIATSAPTTTLSVAEKFQVNSTGNVVKINNVPTSFPSSQGAANTLLRNDGAGNLSWVPIVDYRLVDLNTSASLLGHAVVMDTDTVVKDGNASSISTSLVVGFVKVVGALGTGKVQTIGIVEGVQFIGGLTLAAGDRAFLSKTSGHLTNSVVGWTTPDVMAEVGIVSDASQYALNGTASIIFSTKVPVSL